MPTYRVTAPDGRMLRLTGDAPPSERDILRAFSRDVAMTGVRRAEEEAKARRPSIALSPEEARVRMESVLRPRDAGASKAPATPYIAPDAPFGTAALHLNTAAALTLGLPALIAAPGTTMATLGAGYLGSEAGERAGRKAGRFAERLGAPEGTAKALETTGSVAGGLAGGVGGARTIAGLVRATTSPAERAALAIITRGAEARAVTPAVASATAVPAEAAASVAATPENMSVIVLKLRQHMGTVAGRKVVREWLNQQPKEVAGQIRLLLARGQVHP